MSRQRASESPGLRERPKVCTYLGICAEGGEQAVLPVDLFENDQTLPSLTHVVRHFLVFAQEEQSARSKLE